MILFEFYRLANQYHNRLAGDDYPRLRAWDFLWDHVQSMPTWKALTSDKNLEKSALHLGFYLANWGMLRGSSQLLNANIKFIEDFTAHIFTGVGEDFWNLTLADFTDDNAVAQEAFDEALIRVRQFEPGRISWTDTLVTKVLLGLWGQCPARDINFKEGFKAFLQERPYGRQPRTSGRYLVFLNHIRTEEAWRFPVFRTPGGNEYPDGKVIDMAFFQYGDAG